MQRHTVTTNLGFAKTFLLPALLIFLIPVLAWMFFWHAQVTFDATAREAIVRQLEQDKSMPGPERVAAIDRFAATGLSEILVSDEDVAEQVDPTLRFQYATFRWMIRLSQLSIIVGISVFVLVGLCVLLSLWSQHVQYVSLLAGWHLLRLYGAVQVIVIGILLVELSYWVTALWWGVYWERLILIASAISIAAAIITIMAIFRRVDSDGSVEGKLLDPDQAPDLCNRISTLCSAAGVVPPDSVVLGIDDTFFVTQSSFRVAGRRLTGRTVFLSLPLLKQLNTSESDAILAHEMAHFSGHDTWYSQRISPLLERYNEYLVALKETGTGIVVFYYMNCFRALFEVSVSRLSRQRELRADAIAARTTTPSDFAAALLRTVAYSRYRNSVEQELFHQSQEMQSVNLSTRVESGYLKSVATFVADPAIGTLESAHPFDSHPTTEQRLAALGLELNPESAKALLKQAGDGGWYRMIPDAEELERQLWQVYEDRFRHEHQQSLPYRFLPTSPEELAIVEQAFPAVTHSCLDGEFTIDCEKVMHTRWSAPIRYSEITRMELKSSDVAGGSALEVYYKRIGKSSRQVRIGGTQAAVALKETLDSYYKRYLTAAQYQKDHPSGT